MLSSSGVTGSYVSFGCDEDPVTVFTLEMTLPRSCGFDDEGIACRPVVAADGFCCYCVIYEGAVACWN